MARKPKKGYFVRGEFVAEGSERDLDLKRELKGSDEESRTDLKRQSTELQQLGQQLLGLRADLTVRLNLSEVLADAVLQAKRITSFEGKRRQLQFIGKLMRQQDESVLKSIRAALQEQSRASAQDTLALHQVEAWRARLLGDDAALAQWLQSYPATDAQQLRALIRQARKDARAGKPGEAARQGHAYRELFQLLLAQTSSAPNNPGHPSFPLEPSP